MELPQHFLAKTAQTMARFLMADPAQGVLAAVSGGADSICMAVALKNLGYYIELAHFDHLTRGGESTADAEFAAAFAERLDAPIHLEARDIPGEAAQSDESFEALAREARYAFLTRLARERKLPLIATGHHADDVAETVLIRIVRGCGPSGLAGIPPVRKAASAQGAPRLIRPLIDSTRSEIREALHVAGISFREDRTNTQTDALRNRVRLELLPVLHRDYNPRIAEALVRLAEVQRTESDYMEKQARAHLEHCQERQHLLHRQRFGEAHLALQRRAFLLWAHEHGASPDFARAADAVAFIAHGRAGAAYEPGEGLRIRNSRRHVEWFEASEPASAAVLVPLVQGEETEAFGRRFRVWTTDRRPSHDWRSYCGPRRQVFDADAASGGLTARTRRPGDWFRPMGMKGSKKVKDVLSEQGIPLGERDKLPLICGAGGEDILWIVGCAVAEHARATEQTRCFLVVEVEECA